MARGALYAAILIVGATVAAAARAPIARAGEVPSAGPPWTKTWLDAKREALARGRPIFAYFTKKH